MSGTVLTQCPGVKRRPLNSTVTSASPGAALLLLVGLVVRALQPIGSCPIATLSLIAPLMITPCQCKARGITHQEPYTV
jgi:hypothetical protein